MCKRNNLIWILVLLMQACAPNVKEEPTLFQLQANTGINFTNTVANNKDFNIFSYRNFYNGGGAAIGDINNDGLADVFFTANMGANKLYLNKGNWKFEDITSQAGINNSGKWGTGVVMVDINADGWLDIYVCNAGYQKGVSNENELYINNKDGSFTEQAAAYGLNESGYTTHAAFFDYDLDGDLDCYVLKNSFIPVNTLNYANKRDLRAEDWPVADFVKGGGDKLLRNDGGKYVDVSKEANIYGSLIGFGLGVTVGDVNGDQYPDLYISNDFFERDYLYINQKNGTFKEDLEKWMQHISHSSMGADIGDINNDGYPDVFTTDMLPVDDHRLRTTTTFENYDVNQLKITSGFFNQFMQNTLQVNNKDGHFIETGYYSGVAASDWSWGGLIFDANNDGQSDIFVCNGIYNDVTDQDFIDFFADEVIQQMVMTGQKSEVDQIISRMPSRPIPNKLFQNRGNLRFTSEEKAWGLDQPSFSNGAAYGDLDNDGDLDLVVNNVNQQAFIYRNNSREQKENNFIGFNLKGTGENKFAVGSTIKVFTNGQVLSREIIPSRGFQSSVDYKSIIGLGTTGAVDSVQVIWPDRSIEVLKSPAINKLHVVVQENADRKYQPQTEGTQSLLTPFAQNFDKHTEDNYVDFYYERNVPVMLSREGPKAAHGDVNGDGMDDVYIGGASGQAGQLYIQTTSGFSKRVVSDFERFASFEDVATIFFDCDKDGDLDLYVGSGGSNQAYGVMQNRIYKNDGKGNFSIAQHALPNLNVHTSVAVANDFDGDGDEDLFIGGRNIPENYGLDPLSSFLINDGTGQFTELKTVTNEFKRIGMVTGAVWANVHGDNRKELVISGEWMAPRIFAYTNNNFTEVKTNLAGHAGWWQTVAAADMDGDGDEDLVLGNIGENFYLQPTATAPVKLWINDFDANGTVDKIITRTVEGRDMPVFLKRDLTDQIVSLRKANLKHEDFAKKSIQDLFPAEILKRSTVKPFVNGSTSIAFNDGNGNFRLQKLPMQVQLSSINAIQCMDINKDGLTDLVMGGNQFGLLPQFSRLDASYGAVLLNQGKGVFKVLTSSESGLSVRGQVRDIAALKGRNKSYLLFLQNDDFPVLFEFGRKNSVDLVRKSK